MKLLVQRVSQASVTINGCVTASIGKGMLILLGIAANDKEKDADYLCAKVSTLRIFNDEAGKMNLNLAAVNGSFLVVSQFTLFADWAKGNRPSYTDAARPEKAMPLYEYFIKKLREISNTEVKTGTFGADMKVNLLNDGPVTLMLESRDL